MAFMDLFRRKKEEAEVPPEQPLQPEFGMPQPMQQQGMEHMGMPPPMEQLGMPQAEPFRAAEQQMPPRTFGQQQFASPEQQMQLISAKLDTIKAQLDTVLQRLERLERKGEEERPYQQRWRST